MMSVRKVDYSFRTSLKLNVDRGARAQGAADTAEFFVNIVSSRRFMLRGETLASAGRPSPPAVTGIARAETLGPDGSQRTWKTGPDAAAGPTGAQESAPILFPSDTAFQFGARGHAGVARRPASVGWRRVGESDRPPASVLRAEATARPTTRLFQSIPATRMRCRVQHAACA